MTRAATAVAGIARIGVAARAYAATAMAGIARIDVAARVYAATAAAGIARIDVAARVHAATAAARSDVAARAYAATAVAAVTGAVPRREASTVGGRGHDAGLAAAGSRCIRSTDITGPSAT